MDRHLPRIRPFGDAIRLSRTQGETAKQLSALTGNPAYDSTEVAFEDEWAKRGGDHYAGKEYPKQMMTTEILTMGIERLCNDPIVFAKNDPDYFEFLIKTLQKL